MSILKFINDTPIFAFALVLIAYHFINAYFNARRNCRGRSPTIRDVFGASRRIMQDNSRNRKDSDSRGGAKSTSRVEVKRDAWVGGVRVPGGLLPRKGSDGVVEFYYDEDYPRHVSSGSNGKLYKTTGNIQVFYKKAADAEKVKFTGKNVDIYFRKH